MNWETSTLGATGTNATGSSGSLLGKPADFSGLMASATSAKSSSTTVPPDATSSSSSSSTVPQTTGTFHRFAVNGSRGGIKQSLQDQTYDIISRITQAQLEETDQRLEERVENMLKETRKKNVEAFIAQRRIRRNDMVITAPNASMKDMSSLNTIDRRSFGVVDGLLMNDSGSSSRAVMSVAECDPTIVQEHLVIVQQMGDSPDLHRVIDRFEKVSLMRSNDLGYQTAWALTRELLLTSNLQTPVDGALGALTHLCRQYQGFIRNKVKTASLQGQDVSTAGNYPMSVAASIASFVKLNKGSTYSMWDVLFYCFRCGDAHAAATALSSTPAGNESIKDEYDELSRAIGELSRRQGNASVLFQTGAPVVDAQNRAALLNFYERAKNTESNNKNKIAVLALLCGQPLESTSHIEDYLFGRLWTALKDPNDPIAKIKEVGDAIKKWGPSHFASDGSNAWGYCLPLLVTQQFKTALAFLAENGGAVGMLQAAHLALVYAIANVPLIDIGEINRNQSPSKDLATVLLTNYAKMLESDTSTGILASLQYLLKIQSKEQRREKIAEMIARGQPQIEVLTGYWDPVRYRHSSPLENYLPEQEVSAILERAAEILAEESHDFNKAQRSASLFMLAKSFPKLIEFLLQMTSPPDDPSSEKCFWFDQMKRFYDLYISKRSIVVESLERSGKTNLGTTIEIMLQLRQFFNFYLHRKHEEAFNVIVLTNLLPIRREDIDAKQSQFKDLSPVVKEALPMTLTATVACLFEMFRRLKSESRGVSMEVHDRLKQIENSARCLFIFAGLVNMPASCRENISQMRAMMV